MTEFAYSLPQPWSYRKLGSKSVEYRTGRIVHQDYLYANVQLSDACGSTTISCQWPASMLLLHGLLDFVFVGLSLGEAREVTRECPTAKQTHQCPEPSGKVVWRIQSKS